MDRRHARRRQQENLLVCVARRAASDRRLWLAGIHRQLQRRHRHQGGRARGPVARACCKAISRAKIFSACASAPAPTTSSRSSRSSRNSAMLRSRRWPIRAPAASSWIGAIELALRSKRQADYAWTVLARVLVMGEGSRQDHGEPVRARRAGLSRHPRRFRLERRGRGRLPRTCAHAPASAAIAGAVDRATARRSPAACRGRPTTGRSIRLRQSKTGARVEIPVGAPLKAALDAPPSGTGRSSSHQPTRGHGRRTASVPPGARRARRPASRASRSTICAAPQ